MIRSVALPAEHGGWGFLLEPILLGMLVAPTLTGAWFILAAVGAFLLHQPLKTAIKDGRKGRRVERTRWAERFAALYGLLAVLGFSMTVVRAGLEPLLPLAVAAPLALIQLVYDARNQSRTLIAELSGAVALGAIAPTLLTLGGWSFGAAVVVWMLLALRSVPAILYVRARLRVEREREVVRWPVWAAHIVALLIAVGLWVGWLPVLGLAVLAGRAGLGLSSWRRPSRPAIIGVSELTYGVLFALLLAAAVR